MNDDRVEIYFVLIQFIYPTIRGSIFASPQAEIKLNNWLEFDQNQTLKITIKTFFLKLTATTTNEWCC